MGMRNLFDVVLRLMQSAFAFCVLAYFITRGVGISRREIELSALSGIAK